MAIAAPIRRFAWYGRLSSKDKQDPSLSFPSQRKECEGKADELGGSIVVDFTDIEKGRRDDREGWGELVNEAKRRETRRFDAVVIYATSRLSRDLFHALAYERELQAAGVEVFYALTAGDPTSPEGRLIRHVFQALDQFEVEKLGREVRRGQTENTRQGYRNGGRAPYGYRLKREPHPNPARARVGDTKSRLVPDPDRAPVIVEMFDRYLAGWGYKEIADHFNRPGGPPPPSHVDTKRNTSSKWSKSTIRSMLENPVYAGRLYWNRLDFRAVKQGSGPLVRRDPEDWVQAAERHEALIPEDWFERAVEERHRRSATRGSPRRRKPKRFYLLRGIVHCATGHNPLRMQGKPRKGITYYACGYRLDYGDTAAQAVGHGKWQYVREDELIAGIDRFFETRIFGSNRLAHFRTQQKALARELGRDVTADRQRLDEHRAAIDKRLERQVAAIEAGVDPALVGQRIDRLKAERQRAEIALAEVEAKHRRHGAVNVAEACSVLDALPDFRKMLADADPELKRTLYEAFRLNVTVDRNTSLITIKALVSSVLSDVRDPDDLKVTHKTIAGAGFEPATFGL